MRPSLRPGIRAGTLLERLALAGRTDHQPAGEAQRLRASILANLRRVLGTRQGDAPAQPDLGMPPPSDLIQDHPACIARLQRTLGLCIQRYEPRLTAVRVRHLPGMAPGDGAVLELRFAICAELADGSHAPLAFTTRVDPRGRVGLAP